MVAIVYKWCGEGWIWCTSGERRAGYGVQVVRGGCYGVQVVRGGCYGVQVVRGGLDMVYKW